MPSGVNANMNVRIKCAAEFIAVCSRGNFSVPKSILLMLKSTLAVLTLNTKNSKFSCLTQIFPTNMAIKQSVNSGYRGFHSVDDWRKLPKDWRIVL